MSSTQGTYLVSELNEGQVYRDVLSGRLVLVFLVKAERACVRWFNPKHGEHEDIWVRNHQLTMATAMDIQQVAEPNMQELIDELQSSLQRTVNRRMKD